MVHEERRDDGETYHPFFILTKPNIIMAKLRDITYKVNDNGCHICTSHKPKTRGYFKIGINWKQVFLHRYMYEQKFGPIKEGNIIRHTCDNPGCINPDHLIEGTNADNSQDMINRGRGTHGSKQPNSKLNAQQVIDIFNNNTDSNSKLGREYKISSTVISHIRNGKSWKHITSK